MYRFGMTSKCNLQKGRFNILLIKPTFKPAFTDFLLTEIQHTQMAIWLICFKLQFGLHQLLGKISIPLNISLIQLIFALLFVLQWLYQFLFALALSVTDNQNKQLNGVKTFCRTGEAILFKFVILRHSLIFHKEMLTVEAIKSNE